MPVLVEAFSVVVRREAIVRKFPGGLDGYLRQQLNNTYCADEDLCRVAFSMFPDAAAYVRQLVANGLEGPAEGPSPDFAIVSPAGGHLIPCEWLELEVRWHTVGDENHGATVAKLPGQVTTTFAVPDSWRPGSSIRAVLESELASDYEVVGVQHLEGGGIIETVRHRQTGELLYRGRPDVARVQQRYNALLEELGQIERMHSSSQRAAATAFLKRATQLVEDTNGDEAGPLVLQGVAARLNGDWELAERASRRVTELQPTLALGWNDLTWTLASLGRLEEAERTARHAVELSPDDPASIGNLASVLRERGKLDEALTTIRRAIHLRPGNKINQAIREQILKDQGVPWYRRMFAE